MPKIYCCLLLCAGLLAVCPSNALAQQVNKKALEKANWYTAPREFQIIDDRPVVKDFREGPQQAETVDLGGGSGAGAGAGGAGGGSSIPAGGLHLGKPGVRAVNDGLPKAGFGSNIPARGLSAGAAGSLPSGGLRSYAGQAKAPAAGALPAAGNRSYVSRRNVPAAASRTRSVPAAPVSVRSYSSGYSTAPASRPSTTSEQLKVRGKLLRSQ